MTRYVVDASAALHEAVRRGDIPGDVGRDRLGQVGRLPIRLLGDAFITLDADLAHRAAELVRVAPIEELSAR